MIKCHLIEQRGEDRKGEEKREREERERRRGGESRLTFERAALQEEVACVTKMISINLVS